MPGIVCGVEGEQPHINELSPLWMLQPCLKMISSSTMTSAVPINVGMSSISGWWFSYFDKCLIVGSLLDTVGKTHTSVQSKDALG